MKLSKRLELVAAFVPKGCRLADVGTDHGYVPIYLVRQGQVSHAIAMDVRSGPLRRAGAHIERYRLAEYIEIRRSDGLKELQAGEADTVVIAGMGGELMIRILEEGKHVWDSISTWVFAPQSELYKVRLYLQQRGFAIAVEEMLEEDGKFYTVMRVERGNMQYTREIDLRYGKYLLDCRHPVLKSFLKKEMRQTEVILTRLAAQSSKGAGWRREELKRILAQMKEAYDEMQ